MAIFIDRFLRGKGNKNRYLFNQNLQRKNPSGIEDLKGLFFLKRQPELVSGSHELFFDIKTFR